ncbi:LADA_0E13982g1_1 [Lachancea dasiensis]|uniref:LADA_0E13982g1_1 n=1 Tax=Lachancea dasiensis TaxID=1072105 RepID=A0A1G4JFT6_9SACH|nr:LADA_0E13982g1_1 [Lachancea dasiensis]
MALADGSQDLRQELQQEFETVDAIYPGFLLQLSDTQCELKVPDHERISVHLSFPSGYPTASAPQVLGVKGYPDPKKSRERFQDLMDQTWKQDVCIFDFIVEAAESCNSYTDAALHADSQVDSDPPQDVALAEINVVWFQSDPVVDRGSTFIAFAAHISEEADAQLILDQLRMDPKINKCQHVMTAWRIRGPGNISFQDCDDDGETAAGGRLLHLLTLMDAWDVVVAVARWFTGTHIGPDRFKHINSTARQAVLKGSFADASKAGRKKK